MLNDKPCDTCQHYDLIIRGKKPTKRAWCAKKSLYPHKEGPGQIFPAGVKRASKESNVALPVIVCKGEVRNNCTEYAVRPPGRTKADLIAELQKNVIT